MCCVKEKLRNVAHRRQPLSVPSGTLRRKMPWPTSTIVDLEETPKVVSIHEFIFTYTIYNSVTLHINSCVNFRKVECMKKMYVHDGNICMYVCVCV